MRAKCYNKLRRLIGHQSLTPFSGLHVDLDRIKHDNDKIDGKRKNNCLVSTVEKLTKVQKRELQATNKVKYGLSEEYLR